MQSNSQSTSNTIFIIVTLFLVNRMNQCMIQRIIMRLHWHSERQVLLMPRKKIIFAIVEGPSDEEALAVIMSRILNKQKRSNRQHREFKPPGCQDCFFSIIWHQKSWRVIRLSIILFFRLECLGIVFADSHVWHIVYGLHRLHFHRYDKS